LGITRATLYAKVKQYNLQKGRPVADELPPAASDPAEILSPAAC
jgi:hypothetical protein